MVNWKRLAIFTLLLWLTPQVLGFVSGLTFSDLTHIYGNTPLESSENAKTVRRIVIGVAFFLIYLLFLRRIPTRIFAHVAIIFIAVEFISALTELLLWGKPASDAIYWPAAIRHIVAATLALFTVAAVRRGPN